MGHREETTLTALPDTSGSKNSIQAIGSNAATGMAAAGMDNDGRLAEEEQKPRISEAQLRKGMTSIKESADLVSLQRDFVSVVREAQQINDKNAEAHYLKADGRKRVLRALR
jgi:hypothetical protein